MGDTTRCRSCQAEIRFVRTTSGKLMPLDAAPNPRLEPPVRVAVEHCAANEAAMQALRSQHTGHAAAGETRDDRPDLEVIYGWLSESSALKSSAYPRVVDRSGSPARHGDRLDRSGGWTTHASSSVTSCINRSSKSWAS